MFLDGMNGFDFYVVALLRVGKEGTLVLQLCSCNYLHFSNKVSLRKILF